MHLYGPLSYLAARHERLALLHCGMPGSLWYRLRAGSTPQLIGRSGSRNRGHNIEGVLSSLGPVVGLADGPNPGRLQTKPNGRTKPVRLSGQTLTEQG